jgi:hypothetical protein
MLSSLVWSTYSRCRKPQECSFTSDSEQPRRASPWGTRGLLTTTRRGEPASL